MIRQAPRALLAAAFALCVAAAAHANEVRAEIESGALLGAQQDGVRRFLSIPYAAPPVGELRWRAPQPVAPWQGVRGATRFGPSCMQTELPEGTGPWTAEFFPHVGASEDCLTLSVWTPANIAAGPHLPVLLWLPGGGFRNGGSAVPVNDGAALARQGLVVITINYRVGAFGFLAHPALAREGETSGNYGARDALAALRWVRANAEAFGGDPARITIAGQSAGGGQVAVLLTAPEARGLFAGAIVQSAPLGVRAWRSSEDAGEHAQRFAVQLGADGAEALRAASAEELLALSDSMGGWSPHVDGEFLPQSPWAAFGNGDFADVPMLVGYTANERWSAVDLARHSEDAHRLALYPASNDAEANQAFYAYERDRTRAGLMRWAAARAQRAQSPVYLYLWSHAPPGPDADRYKAFHSSEMPYMFGAFDAARPYAEADREISARMLGLWANFVRGGNPNAASAPAWLASEAPDFAIMDLGENWRTLAPLDGAKRMFIEAEFARDGAFAF
jgi:para-nitrobenzyl esterase